MARNSQAQKPTAQTDHTSNTVHERSSDSNSLGRQLLIAMVAGLIAAATTLLASKLTVIQQENSFKNEKYFGLQKEVLDKRFALMERFIQISQKNVVLTSLDMNEELHLIDLKESVDKRNASEASKKITEGISATEKFGALRSEYYTVIYMSKSIFGPETRKALDALVNASNPRVWKADSKYVEKTILAMSGELTYGLNSVPVETHPE